MITKVVGKLQNSQNNLKGPLRKVGLFYVDGTALKMRNSKNNDQMIKHSFLILILFTIVFKPLRAENYLHLSGAGTDLRADQLTFTNTQKWNREFDQLTRKRPKILSREWAKIITLPAPPANSSPRTTEEITYLKTLISKRSSKLPEITAEINLPAFRFGKYTYEDLTTSSHKPNTNKLLKAAYHDLAIVTFVMKKKFNRVRPSKIDTELGHAISIPEHPAYPSGHATGAYIFAYILQELDASKADTYLKDAQRIAENREIAGLHYPRTLQPVNNLLASLLINSKQTPPSSSSYKKRKPNGPKTRMIKGMSNHAQVALETSSRYLK